MKNFEVNEKQALLDKVTFGNVIVESIDDMQSLIDRQIVEINLGSKRKYLTMDNQEFDRLTISNDGVIDQFKAGVVYARDSVYGTLQLSVRNDDSPGNLVCNTVGDYHCQLERVKSHLLDAYGITINYDYLTMREIEINRTFRLDGKFRDYRRVFTLIMAILPKKSYMKTYAEYGSGFDDRGKNVETFYKRTGGKNYLELVIYDKTAEMIGTISITDNYARLEFKIVGSTKIKKELKTNRFSELTDEKINSWFDGKIKSYITDPLAKWQKARNERVLQLMLDRRGREDASHWVSNTLAALENLEIAQGYPEILDVEEIIPLVRKMGLKPQKGSKVKAAFRKQAEKLKYKNVSSAFCNGDDKKLTEIIAKLTAKPDILEEKEPDEAPGVEDNPSGGNLKIA